MRKELAIGIDMGGTSVKMGVVQGAEIIQHCEPIPTANYEGAGALIQAMCDRIREIVEVHTSIKAVGIGVPGFTDVRTGVVHELTNVPGWHEVALNPIIREATGIPATAENDANCMAFAEFKHGAGMGALNMIAVTLGTGVGGGLVLNGQLFRGSQCGAGEIGQMSIDYCGKRGTYGNTGALEEYIGNREIALRAKSLYASAGKNVALEDCEPKDLAANAVAGDPVALQMWDEITTQLACALANCVWLINPDKVVIGGGIAKAGDLLFKPLKDKMKNQLAKAFRNGLEILPAKFGNEAGVIGSAAVALESLATS